MDWKVSEPFFIGYGQIKKVNEWRGYRSPRKKYFLSDLG